MRVFGFEYCLYVAFLAGWKASSSCLLQYTRTISLLGNAIVNWRGITRHSARQWMDIRAQLVSLVSTLLYSAISILIGIAVVC